MGHNFNVTLDLHIFNVPSNFICAKLLPYFDNGILGYPPYKQKDTSSIYLTISYLR
jgi:hypothetical protein